MKKLLQINICVNKWSTGRIVEQIGLSAMSHGWESFVIYGNSMNPSKSRLIKVGPKLNKYLHYIEQRIFDNEGLCSRFLTKRIVKKIEAIKPDIIHLHNIHDHYINYRILFQYLNQTEIKVVWTFHDCWAFTGHCFHFVTKDCTRWMDVCHNCPLSHDDPDTLFDRSRENFLLKKQLFSSNKNLTIVPCSEWLGNFVRSSFLKDKRIEIIRNGVDISLYSPSRPKLSAKSNEFNILAVSSVWQKSKGLYDIFELRRILPHEYIITMVGLNDSQLKEIPQGIVGVKRTSNIQELVDLYSSSDVLINPTYADTFPTINLEALACGTPVITYKTGGSPEAIDGKTGIVIEQGDVVALANALMNMKNNPYSPVDCRKRAVDFFDKDKCFKKYVDLYEQLLG